MLCEHCGALSSGPAARVPDSRRAVLIAEFLMRHEGCVPHTMAWTPVLRSLSPSMRAEVVQLLGGEAAARVDRPRALRLCPPPESPPGPADQFHAWDLLSEELPEDERRLELV